MTEPHKRNRHPKYKTAYRVKNWHEYDKALRDRGNITRCIGQDAIDAWTPPQTGKRGAQPVYSDHAIETALTFRLLFHPLPGSHDPFTSQCHGGDPAQDRSGTPGTR